MSLITRGSSEEDLFEVEFNKGVEDADVTDVQTQSGAKNIGKDVGKDVNYVIKNKGSIFVLLELPIFAFLIYLFFYKKKRFYTEAFVMSLHLQTFLFLSLLFGKVVTLPCFSDYAMFLSFLIYFGYTVIAFKKYYQIGFWSSFFKLVLIQSLQFIFLLIIVVYVLVVAYFRGVFDDLSPF